MRGLPVTYRLKTTTLRPKPPVMGFFRPVVYRLLMTALGDQQVTGPVHSERNLKLSWDSPICLSHLDCSVVTAPKG